MYYKIDEELARSALAAYSFREYLPGSATAEYRQQVDRAAALAAKCKEDKDDADKAKIDRLLDMYARRLAENINSRNRNTASCPSVLITGASNFPTRKKEKQNAREDVLMCEYKEICGILDRIRSVGAGGIKSGDPAAVEKLKAQLVQLEALQERMKKVNAYYRKSKTLDGCPDLTEKEHQSILKSWEMGWYKGIPFPPYELQNNGANIRRIKGRIAAIEKEKAVPGTEVEGNGYTYKEDSDLMRVQFFFDGKPSEEIRDILKTNGFHWAPSLGAWQRQLSPAGRAAARRVMAAL